MATAILDGRLLWEIVWQSTFWLGLGLTLSILLRNRPARAHQVLWLAVLAAILTPALSAAVRDLGWGVFAPAEQTPSQTLTPDERDVAERDIRNAPTASATDHPQQDSMAISGDPSTAGAVSPDVEANGLLPRFPESPAAWWFAVLWVWAAASCILLGRLAWASVGAFRIIARSRPAADQRRDHAANLAAARLGLKVQPEVRMTPDALVPVVWCWSRQPLLMVPADAPANDRIDWCAVFCHELGHWRRRDHWSALAAELVVCLLPWHPLAWCARRRITHLSELACDDWAVGSGASRPDFAEALLSFVPSRQNALVLCAVSTRGLPSRIKRVLSNASASPRTGAAWTSAACALALSMSALVAVAQPSAPRRMEAVPKPARPQQENITEQQPFQPVKGDALQQNQIVAGGRIVGPNGEAVAGARVYVSKPFFHEWTEVGVSDKEGRVGIAIEGAAKNPGDDANGASIRFAAVAEGFGFNWLDVKRSDLSKQDALTFRLLDDVPIEGRILTPEGQPAPNVAVYVRMICQPRGGNLEAYLQKASEDDPFGVRNWGDNIWSGKLPGHAALRTDDDGVFRLSGVGAERLVDFSLKGEAIHNWWIIVATRRPERDGRTANSGALYAGEPLWSVHHYYAAFTHVSAPSRTLRGVVRDQETGRPVPDVLVKADFASSVESPSNEAGEFMIIGARKQARYTIEAHPRDSGYFNRQLSVRDQPGIGPLETEIGLIRGITVRGRVTDKATGRPVTGTVQYYPLFPNVHVERFGGQTSLPSSTCEIHDDGSYELQVLPGPGALGVVNFDSQYTQPPPFDLQQVEKLLDGFQFEGNSKNSLATAAGGQAMGVIGRGQFRALSLIKPDGGADALNIDLHLIPGRDIADSPPA